MTALTTIAWLLFFAILFAVSGMAYARRHINGLEGYIVARNSQTAIATMLTLLASSLGAWVLFAPAQAATWGGLAAVIGYSLGAMSPRLVMIPLGRRMRALIPQGHSLSEFVIVRYGPTMHVLCLLIMVFYLFITITAEITAIAKLVHLIAPVPLWLTALIILMATLAYTAYGGLRASIFTDKIQILVILPLLLMLCYFGWLATGGISYVMQELYVKAPHLLDLKDGTGIKAGVTFFIAILLTGVFHQGNWQRVYSAKSSKVMRSGFFIAALLVVPVVFVMGLFGLAFVALDAGKDSSVALFSIVFSYLPNWFVVLLIPLGLALVMSSADTAMNAVSSLVAVELRRLYPSGKSTTIMLWAKGMVIPLVFGVWFFASKGYSVLYLFLLADLLCSAAAYPVFAGLFNKHLNGRIAILSTLAGLIAGLALFPKPNQPPTYLLESFLVAALVPIFISFLLTRIWPIKKAYDFSQLKTLIQNIDKSISENTISKKH